MNYNELNQVLEQLNEATIAREEAYLATDGEITETTEAAEADVEYLRELLTTEGVDLLGRWLKSKEDRKKALKAEKDYLSRQIEVNDRSIEFVKGKIAEILLATGEDKVKGTNGYSFARTESNRTEVEKDILEDMFRSKVEEAVKGILPCDVTITLKASVSAVPEGSVLPEYYKVTTAPSVRFVKPRSKE